MKILAIDSSGMVASVAIWEDDLIIAEYSTNFKKTHSQTLLPMLEKVRDMIELDMNTVDAIAVAAGPGSFTGLRIGSATAKGLGLALDCPIISVPTLEGMAYQFWGSDKLICPMMDARRSQVYTGLYGFSYDDANRTYQMETVWDQCAVPIEELIDAINSFEREVIFLGDGVPVFEKILAEKLEVPYSFAPAQANRQRAGAIAAAAALLYKEGKTESAAEHAPFYLRLSQAERERAEKIEGGNL